MARYTMKDYPASCVFTVDHNESMIENFIFLVSASNKDEATGKAMRVANEILKSNDHLTRMVFASVGNSEILEPPKEE